MSWKELAKQISGDPRVQRNIDYGKPRRGHSEGTVRKHIEELSKNLAFLTLTFPGFIDQERFWRLSVLILVHDSFKWESDHNVEIIHPRSHASIAALYLREFTDDEDMLNIVQYHDVGFALYRKMKNTGAELDEMRLRAALARIKDLDLFLLFCIIDACTESKGREMIRWWVAAIRCRYQTKVGPEHILAGPDKAPGGEF